MSERVRIIVGDCRERLRELADERLHTNAVEFTGASVERFHLRRVTSASRSGARVATTTSDACGLAGFLQVSKCQAVLSLRALDSEEWLQGAQCVGGLLVRHH